MSEIITINVFPVEESITLNVTEELVTVNVNVISGSGSGISDAPSNGLKYGRKDASWVEIDEFSGDYNDLANKPTIPDATSDLTNDSGFITSSDLPVINEHFKGKFSTLSALQTAFPTAIDGDYAVVDAGSGSNALEYIWDSNDGWVLGNSVGATTTDALPEGTSNLYFTNNRAISALSSSLQGKVDKVSGKDLSKNDFTDQLKSKLENVLSSEENVVTILSQSPEGQFNRAHGTIVINDKLYIGTREGATSKLLRYNGTTLEESIIVPMDSAKGIENMCYDGTKIFFCVNHSGNFLVEVNPLDFTDIVYHTITGVNLLDAVICTDNTYIYGVEHEPANIKFFKIRISDFTVVATNTWTGRFMGHSVGINIPAGYMNVTTQGKYYARVQLSDLSFVEKDLTGYSTVMTDDMVVIRDDQNDYGANYVILGSEFYDGSDSVGGLILNTDVLDDPIKIPMMPTVGLFLSNDATMLYNTSNEGFIQTWNLASLLFSLFYNAKIETNVYTYRGTGFPNEILETSTALYFTNWDTTTSKGVINKCELVAKDKPLITQKEAYYNSLSKANISDLANKVDKVTGKGLSTEDYTTTEKNKLASITEIFTTALKSAYDNSVSSLATLLATGSRLITTTEITTLSNTSGTNSGDNAVNSLYSGLAASKEDTSNKSTSTADSSSSIKFPVWSAVVSYISTALSSYATTSYVTSALSSFKTTNFLDFTSSGQTQLDAKATKIMGAFSFRVNNTNASANSTETNFKSLPKATLGVTPTFTAGTAPSGTTTHSYSGQWIGSTFFGKIDLVYGVAGATVTQIIVPLPSDWPTPVKPDGYTAASERIAIGTGFAGTNTTGVTQSQYACILRSNSANTGFELVLTQASASSRYFHLSITYPTA